MERHCHSICRGHCTARNASPASCNRGRRNTGPRCRNSGPVRRTACKGCSASYRRAQHSIGRHYHSIETAPCNVCRGSEAPGCLSLDWIVLARGARPWQDGERSSWSFARGGRGGSYRVVMEKGRKREKSKPTAAHAVYVLECRVVLPV